MVEFLLLVGVIVVIVFLYKIHEELVAYRMDFRQVSDIFAKHQGVRQA
jgi:hypothetical protein